MEATILRSDVMRQLDGGEPFTMEFVTADRKRGTGGELVKVVGWEKICGIPAEEARPGKTRRSFPSDPIRNPNHRINKTVNIFNPHSNRAHPISVHVRLIQTFNDKRVING